jgi:hypothetical protein
MNIYPRNSKTLSIQQKLNSKHYLHHENIFWPFLFGKKFAMFSTHNLKFVTIFAIFRQDF